MRVTRALRCAKSTWISTESTGSRASDTARAARQLADTEPAHDELSLDRSGISAAQRRRALASVREPRECATRYGLTISASASLKLSPKGSPGSLDQDWI